MPGGHARNMSWGKALIREAQIYRDFVLFLILSGRRMT